MECPVFREFRFANIRSLAAYERARRALRGECEPMRLRRRVRFLVRVASTEKEKAGLFPRLLPGAYRTAVYCEFGDVSSGFVRPCQLDQSLNPNRKQVREFAPPYKASDTEAAEQCCAYRASGILPGEQMKAPLYKKRNDLIRVIASGNTHATSSLGEIPRTGHQHRKRKSRTIPPNYFRVHTAQRYIASLEMLAPVSLDHVN